jgi:hypothetical protein
VQEVLGWLTALAASAAAGAAIWLATLSRAQVRTSQQQVKLSQDQVEVSEAQARQALESQYDLFRPVVIVMPSVLAEFPSFYVRNIGPGAAMHIRALFCFTASAQDDERFVGFGLPPIMLPQSQELTRVEGAPRSLVFPSSSVIGSNPQFTLLAQPQPLPVPFSKCVGRFTITYRDLFGRKHGSVHDFYTDYGWQPIAFLSNIVDDLLDLGYRAAPMEDEARESESDQE